MSDFNYSKGAAIRPARIGHSAYACETCGGDLRMTRETDPRGCACPETATALAAPLGGLDAEYAMAFRSLLT